MNKIEHQKGRIYNFMSNHKVDSPGSGLGMNLLVNLMQKRAYGIFSVILNETVDAVFLSKYPSLVSSSLTSIKVKLASVASDLSRDILSENNMI